MPVIITKDNTEYYLVPAPLVSFSRQTFNNVGRPGLGGEYSVSLQGTLIQTHGNPYFTNGTANLASGTGSGVDWVKTPEVEPAEITEVSGIDRLNATIKKQELIRSLFSNPMVSGVTKPIKVQIRGWDEGVNPGSGLYFYGFVDDISFDSDGRWANPGSYTVSLRTSNFIASANQIFESGRTEFSPSGFMISSLSENFDIQEDGRKTLSWDKSQAGNQIYRLDHSDKVYTVNRSITAVGSPVYDDQGGYLDGISPWQQASGFVHEYLNIGSGVLSNFYGIKTSGANLAVSGSYNVADFIYQESIDREAGTYSLTETFVLYSGISPVIETITVNRDVGENGSNTINVQGTIQGLNTANGFDASGNAYNNAFAYWTGIVDTGVPSTAYYYAKGALTGVQWLHPAPLSKSIASDFAAGTISYTYNFDDRPPNIVPGSISESIQVSDTYPGEIFSVTPVIGRSQPVLQYLNSRSEYKRSLSINITMGPTPGINPANVNNSGILFNDIRNTLQGLYMTYKPSINPAQRTALNEIFQAMNPVNDVYFNVPNGRCYHSAPNESWDARTRNYSYSIEWTYERT
jgi:hypothetical protein